MAIGASLLCACGNNQQQQSQSIPDSTVSSERKSRLNEKTLTLIKKYSPDKIRRELLARSNYGTISDSFQALVAGDTQKPRIRTPELSVYSNDELIMGYHQQLLDLQTPTVLYGLDNRKEIAEIGNTLVQNNALTVVAIIDRDSLSRQSDGSYLLVHMMNYKEKYNLCARKEEFFLDEQSCPDCTGFAISPNLVASAGHCLDNAKPKKYYLVFDYRQEDIPLYTSRGIPDSLVYEITEVLQRPKGSTDYSVSRVNKPIPSRRIATLSNSQHFTNDTHFYVLGFPCGLPMKYTDQSSLRSDTDPNFFVINSNTYKGNSGSPVFNSLTNEVEGILVRGNIDFKIKSTDSTCQLSLVCGPGDCSGEEVTRIAFIYPYLLK